MKKKATLLAFMFFLFGLSGCVFNLGNPYPYDGAYIELYTTAIYSIPDAQGYMHHGEGAYDSEIYIWEQDDYGRTLFSYCEDYSNEIFGLVLCQTFDDTNVYFYPEANYVLTFIDSSNMYDHFEENHLKNTTETFYLKYCENLKEKNDWNKPLDISKCISYPITDHKIIDKNTYSLSSVQCNEILNEYSETLQLANPSDVPHRSNKILQVDAEGKILHEIYGLHDHYDNPNWDKRDEYSSYDIVLWVITDKAGNYDKENGIMVMCSAENGTDNRIVYDADAISEFKAKNDWKYDDLNDSNVVSIYRTTANSGCTVN